MDPEILPGYPLSTGSAKLNYGSKFGIGRENKDLRASIQQFPPKDGKRFKRSGDIIIKNSTNLKIIINLELSHVSFSKVL